jgi:hypothetical protein
MLFDSAPPESFVVRFFGNLSFPESFGKFLKISLDIFNYLGIIIPK